MTQEITIIGAGIGGLMAAVSLQHYGFKVTIYEQAPQLAEVGAGLTLTPNATHALAHVGLLDKILAVGNQPGPGIIRHWQSGETLVETRKPANPQDKKPADKYGSPICQMHRADLHTILLEAVLANDPECIQLNHQLKHIEQQSDAATITFHNGHVSKSAVVIACDGVRSVVREQLFSPEPVLFTGQVAFRGLIPMHLLDTELVTPKSAISIGPGRFFLRYHIKDSTLLNYIAVTTSDTWTEEGWSTPATNEEALALYEGWDPLVRRVIGATPKGNLFKWALCARGPLPTWIKGRVVLLGDACHPATPYLGQGAAMAIEDGLILARSFALESNFQNAFQRYEKARLPRTTELMAMALEQGKRYQAENPEDYDAKTHSVAQNDSVFGYNPATIPI